MSRLTDYKDAVYTNPWGDYDAEEDAGGGTADDKPSRSDAKFLYAAGLATRAQLESWFGSSTAAIIVAEAANLSDSQKATVAALQSSAPAGEVQGNPAFAEGTANLFGSIANTLNTVLDQSVPQSKPAAGDFAATDANLVKQAKDGAITADEAYASLRANGASAEQAVAYMAARGVYYEPPPENTGAPGNVGGATGSTSSSGGTGGATGGGSAGGGGTGTAVEIDPYAGMTKEQIAAAKYDEGIAQANAALDAWATQQGVRVFKDADNPGSGFYYDQSGKLVPVGYVAQRGRVETGVAVSGNNYVQGPGGFETVTNPGRSAALDEARQAAGSYQLTPEQAAIASNLGIIEGGRYIKETLGLDYVPTLSDITSLTGVSTGGTTNAYLGAEGLAALSRGPEIAGARERFEAAAAKAYPDDPVRQEQYIEANIVNSKIQREIDGPQQNATRFEDGVYYDQNGQEIEREGTPPEVRAQNLALAQSQARSRGISLTSSNRGFQFMDANGQPLNLGNFDNEEQAWAAYNRWLAGQREIENDARNNFDAQPIQMSAAQNRSVNNLGSSAFGGNLNQPSSAYPGPRNGGMPGPEIPPPSGPPTPDPVVPTTPPAYKGPLIYQPPYEVPGFNEGGTVMGMRGGKAFNFGKPSMVVGEEIVGVGAQTGKPHFMMNEGRDGLGGEVVPEMMSIQPMTQPMGFNEGGNVYGGAPAFNLKNPRRMAAGKLQIKDPAQILKEMRV